VLQLTRSLPVGSGSRQPASTGAEHLQHRSMGAQGICQEGKLSRTLTTVSTSFQTVLTNMHRSTHLH
jgi:hypothetical protein